jgi:hypothetical protein
MKAKFTILVVITFLFSTNLFSQGLADQIKIDSLKKYVQELSGDKSITLGGVTSVIKTRNTTYPSSDINTAAAYIKNKLESFGLPAYEQPFSFVSSGTTYNAKNIYAIQTGSQYPDKKYIICAHYDSYAFPGSIAPGADDNASGTAAVIEAARVLSKLSPKYTIVYALWSGEEQGLHGSWFYANKARSENEDILGVLNLDMIAWDKNGDNIVEIIYKNISSENPQYLKDNMANLLNKVSSANQLYNIGTTILKYSDASANSDHYPFLNNDYAAFLMIEENNDFNTEYHKVTDLFSSIYYNFFEKCSKLAICTLADLAQTSIIVEIDDKKSIPADYVLLQNYPNPFNPGTVIRYRLANAGYVKLKIFDAIGREVKTLVDEYQPAGEHQAQFSITGNTLTSGIYIYNLQAGNQLLTKKMVYLK